MKHIDFAKEKIGISILKTAIPMLLAQTVNLLYNVVDRIYIARIPVYGTKMLGAVLNGIGGTGRGFYGKYYGKRYGYGYGYGYQKYSSKYGNDPDSKTEISEEDKDFGMDLKG